MKTALIVIDVQNIYTDKKSEMYCKNSKQTVERINELIKKFKKKKLPIYLIRHIHKANGSDLGRMFDYEGEEPEGFNFVENSDEVKYDSKLIRPKNVVEIIKNRYSAFRNTRLEKDLKKKKVDTVVICGFMTNFCCESTARDAHDLDYYVDFITDATGTPGTDKFDEKEIRKIVSDLLANGFARVTSTKKYLSNL